MRKAKAEGLRQLVEKRIVELETIINRSKIWGGYSLDSAESVMRINVEIAQRDERQRIRFKKLLT